MDEREVQTMTEVREAPAVRRTTRWTGPVGVVAAAVTAGAVTWLLWSGPGGAALEVDPDWGPQQEVGLLSVLVASAVVTLAGLVTGHLLWRRARRPHRAWRITAWTVCVLSLGSLVDAVSTTALLGLASLHLVVGATVAIGVELVHRDD